MLRFKKIYEIWRRDNSLVRAHKESYGMLEKTHGMFRESVKLLRDSEAAEVDLSIYEDDRIGGRYCGISPSQERWTSFPVLF